MEVEFPVSFHLAENRNRAFSRKVGGGLLECIWSPFDSHFGRILLRGHDGLFQMRPGAFNCLIRAFVAGNIAVPFLEFCPGAIAKLALGRFAEPVKGNLDSEYDVQCSRSILV